MFGYPTQISLIPTTVALVRFIEEHGFVSWYPYWYLGNPLHYLTGPILPVICLVLHRIFPALNFFDIVYILIFFSFILGPLGLFFFVRKLSGNFFLSLVSFLFFLFLPWHYFSGLVLDNGSHILALMVLPWVLWLSLFALEKWHKAWVILATLAMAFVILIDSLIGVPLVVGLVLFVSLKILKSTEGIEIKIAKALFLLVLGWLLTFWWFSPGYWLTILQAPSLAGKGLLSVVVWLGRLLLNLVPLVLAVFSVSRFKKIKDRTLIFTLGWLGFFGFLTLMRFLSDPDFWQDWSSYGVELELGIAMALGLILNRWKFSVFQKIFSVSVILGLAAVWGYAFRWTPLLIPRKNIENTVEYRIGKQLSEIAKPLSASSGQAGERVFLSGSTAFWLNAFFDIPQVRGGKDETSVEPLWRQAAWEIREGPSTSSGQENTEKWLKTLNVSYLVVHTQDSEEYYHDFSHPEKFESAKSLKKVFSDKGDVVYRVEGVVPSLKEEEYKDWTKPIGWGISLLAVLVLFLFPKSWELLSAKMPKLDLGGEENY